MARNSTGKGKEPSRGAKKSAPTAAKAAKRKTAAPKPAKPAKPSATLEPRLSVAAALLRKSARRIGA